MIPTSLKAALAASLALAAPAFAADGPYSRATLLAHRGVHQDFHREGLDGTTCTAARMVPPTHGYLENTIASIQAAFDLGANMVEIDIHPTTDGEFVVFHDWTVDCRTNGTGVTRKQDLAYLKSLDIGHGYTADGGATFPFRGRFVGAMPTWREVIEAFPDRRFLVNIKSNDPAEGRAAVAYARKLGLDERTLAFSGGERPMNTIREDWPAMRTVGRERLKSCFLRYLGIGWTGTVPEACHGALIYVPVNFTKLMWGWPERFLQRMAAVRSEVFVVGPYGWGDKYSSGIDTVDLLSELPTNFAGGIITNRIEVIGPAIKAR